MCTAILVLLIVLGLLLTIAGLITFVMLTIRNPQVGNQLCFREER